ncbi:Hypothetical predicted protein [Octopus vulgaris]|uniref:Uncharacterized protein n=1 Tax=Octopus vulgaris TaxID=6645 RepID=A0AA36APZ0_OCTVU|nr:Hypothetical predicted protein [Octopus vulgaris]
MPIHAGPLENTIRKTFLRVKLLLSHTNPAQALLQHHLHHDRTTGEAAVHPYKTTAEEALYGTIGKQRIDVTMTSYLDEAG